MIDIDKWREIFSSLSRHKLRTFLTAFSVWWGIFMLVILLGAGKGLSNSVEEDFKSDALSIIRLWAESTSQEYKGLPPGRRLRFSNDEFDMLSEVEGVREMGNRYFLTGEYFIKYKNNSLSFDVQCVNPSYIKFENPELLAGRLLNQKDINEKRKICVIGIKVKEGFFPNGKNPIGEYLNIKGTDYQVVGVVTDTGWEGKKRRIYLPTSTTQLVEGTTRIHQLIVEMGDVSLEESQVIEERLRLNLATKMKFNPSDKQAIYINNNIENYNRFKSTMNMISGFIWFVGIGSIIAGVIGVSNIMLIVVKERTKEIGIRKALGATPYSIVSMIVQESIFLTSISGYLGLLCGMGVIISIQSFMKANEIDAQYFRNPEVDMQMVLTALVILIISGGLAGLIPALQAVKVNAVEAMKG